ncbi:oligosaccharide flippase family protein [Fictibacillus nanhaiensis]|uniref:Oligosaccharide flippase family protein n=1 Tax=Fictibacillus nanhaiensis TaxID=742169 RepID=A0ABS2ZS40_9BACL|nr:oligosaccharide flippase family protein [Fictibacillus nanhaiensis]
MRSIVSNVIHLLYSTVLSRILFAAALIVLAQYLNAREYGMFSVALAFSMVMGFFTDAGVSNTVIRESSKTSANIVKLLSSYIKLRLILLFGTLFVSVIFIELFYEKEGLKEVFYYMLVPVITGLALQNISITYFQMVEKMHNVGLIRIWSSVACVVFVVIGMLLKLPVTIIALLFGFSYVLGGLYSLLILFKHTRVHLREAFEKKILFQLSPFIVSGLLMMLLPQLGPLVLEKTLLLHYVGLFAIAYRIPSALYQVPGVVAGAFYPVLFRYWNSGDREKHLNLNITQLKVMGLIGIIITIPLFHMSTEVIRLLFGKEWLSASEPLRIVSIVLFLQSLSFALADGLTTKGLQTRRTCIQLVAVLLAIVVYYSLSLRFGLYGAAYSVVFIECFAVICFWLANPSWFLIGKRVLLPYLVTGVVSLYVTSSFIDQSIFSAVLNLFIILFLPLLDGELRSVILNRYKISQTQQVLQYKIKEKRL